MKLDPSLNLLTLVTRNGKDRLRQVGGLGVDRSELTLYFAATVPQMAEPPAQVARIAGHLQDGTLDVGTSGLNISMIKNLLKSTVEQFIQVIVSTALILGGVILMAADFGPQLAPELKLFTYFGAWVRWPGVCWRRWCWRRRCGADGLGFVGVGATETFEVVHSPWTDDYTRNC